MSAQLLPTTGSSCGAWLSCVIAIAGIFLAAESGPQGIKVKPDLECVVAVDGKIVGRPAANEEVFFPVGIGKHTVAAVTSDGDYWEQSLDASAQPSVPVAIPLQRARSHRQALQSSVSALRGDVEQKKQQLAAIQSQNSQLARNAEVIRQERRLIVEAIKGYATRTGSLPTNLWGGQR